MNFLRWLLCVVIFGLAGSAGAAERQYDCGQGHDCPEVMIHGDPVSTTPNQPVSLFRGYGDPDLMADEKTGEVWLGYSWLQNLNPAAARRLVGGVRPHLAKAIGRDFQFVRRLSDNLKLPSPKGSSGWFNHEVTSLLQRPNGSWESLWLTYHIGLEGKPFEGGAFLARTLAKTPPGLGLHQGSGYYGKASVGPFRNGQNLSDIGELSKCALFTEPAQFLYQGRVYLGLNCLRFGLTGRQPLRENFVLLREGGAGYEFVSVLLTGKDAKAFGAERIEQVDFFIKQNGEIGMLGTPIRGNMHLGCHFWTFSDFVKGQLERGGSGRLVTDMVLKDSGSQPVGTGACSYHRKYSGGVLLVRRNLPPVSKTGVVFSLLRTGLHP